jgi:hypothetical protein
MPSHGPCFVVNADPEIPIPRWGAVIAIVVRSYAASRLASVAQYLTHDARHLAVETHDGSSLADALAQFDEIAGGRGDGLAFTQLALSLASEERGTADAMFAAGRALLDAMGMQNRPTIAVLHGAPAPHLHVHLIVPLADRLTGELHPLPRLSLDAWEAAQVVAPRFGWEPPRRDDRERRRESRAARSLGVWHGERSLHAWLGEVAGPRILPRIDAAKSWAEVAAALAEFGLRYARTERGAVIEDHSSEPPRRVAASALAFRASANALEKRLGRTPSVPVPGDARANPLAYANDTEGRTLPVGTPADRRAFAAAHATWRAVWLPVREQHLAAQREAAAARKAALMDGIHKMRALRDEVAENRREWLEANRFVREYRRLADEELRDRGKAERAAIYALPFAQRPPSRLLEWLRARGGATGEVPTLSGPIAGTARDRGTVEAGITPYRSQAGLEGDTEWWTERRRVAIDRGAEIVVCDPAALGVALAVGSRRWPRIRVAGDQPFRDEARAAAEAAGLQLDFAERAEVDGVPMPDVPEHADVRTAAAIAQHLGLRELVLDGEPFRPDRAEQQPPPRPGTRSTVAFASSEVVVLSANEATLRTMERAGFVAALETWEAAVFVFDRQTTAEERTAITDALIRTYAVERREALPIVGAIRYHAPGMCEGFRRLLAGMRPPPRKVSFTERVQVIQRFLDGLAPQPDGPAIVAPRPAPAPVATHERKRGSRRR